MVIGFLALLGYSEYLTKNNPEAGYYFIQSRAFELLSGALLAIAMHYKRELGISFSKHIYQISGAIGITSLIGLAWLLDESQSFPGINALWVALASCLIILSGESKTTLTSRFLSLRPALLIGRLSYSLYLWHWPVLAFYRYYFSKFETSDAIICGLITICLSLLSWKLIENPLRHLNIKKRWVYICYLILPIVLSVITAKKYASEEGFPGRFSPEVLALYQLSSHTFDDEKLTLPTTDEYPPFEPYIFGDNTKEISTFAWGDSHAGHFRSFVELWGERDGFSTLFGGLGGCPPLLGVDLIKHGQPEEPCSERNQEIAQKIAIYKPDMVFWLGDGQCIPRRLELLEKREVVYF